MVCGPDAAHAGIAPITLTQSYADLVTRNNLSINWRKK